MAELKNTHTGRIVKDLTGEMYGRLTVIERAGRVGKEIAWLCACTCGSRRIVSGHSMKRGLTKSCGCLVREKSAARVASKNGNFRHGLSKSGEYGVWNQMIQRCTNPNVRSYRLYGARGIFVCQRWLESFNNFLADMGPRTSPAHTLERSDNSGNYEPGNCRWATKEEQGQNKRNNRLVTAYGETKCVTEWARVLRIAPNTIYARLAKGLSAEQALKPITHSTITGGVPC